MGTKTLFGGFEFTASIRWNVTPVVVATTKKAEALVVEFLGNVIYLAKANVYPGQGPSQHPHRGIGASRVDTGNLMNSIRMLSGPKWQGSRCVGSAGSTSEAWYGVELERGWTAPSGQGYAYPWLFPALIETINAMPEMLGSEVEGPFIKD